MDFELSEELAALRDSVRRLAVDKIKPRAREVDQTGAYPQDFFDAFRDAGLLGLCIPEEYGGAGAGIMGLGLAIEEVTKYSNVAGLMLLLTRLPTGPVLIAGSEDQKRRYLPGIADGTTRCAFGLSEPQAGSDVVGMRTKARPDADVEGGWILDGVKCWMSGVRQADWFTVFAKTGDPASRQHDSITAFIVDRGATGVSTPSVDKKMGVRGVDTGELVLDGVRVGPENVIGEVGGFRLAMLGLNAMRPIVAARGLGLAEGALMYATEYVKAREAFGTTISSFQGIQWEIAKLAVDIEAARLLTYRAAWLADQGKYTREYVPFLSMAKYHATEVAVRASGLAVQLLGAAGYMEDHPTELWYRDARQLTIVEGTSQVQLGLIARGVLDHDLWWDWRGVPVSLAEQIAELVDGRSLGASGAAGVLAAILTGQCPPEQIAGFLVAMAAKGPTTEELVGLLDTMTALGVRLELPDELLERAVDVVGTGGDGLGTVNVSTMAGFVVAGSGVPVVKHGSRRSSSLVGAADLLEALGVTIAPGPEAVVRCVAEAGFGFCFAPAFHPALAAVAPVRAALGIRTVFNYLGPMANPAQVRHLLLGVSDPLLVDLIAAVIAERGVRHALVVRGEDGLDEVSTSARTRVVEVTADAGDVSLVESHVDPTTLGIALAAPGAIRGGDAASNAAITRAVLAGAPGPVRDVVVLNAAAALVAAAQCAGISEGISAAEESVDSGAASRVLERVVAISSAS